MMPKSRLFIIVLVGFTGLLSSQSQFKDSTDVYNYWTNRAIIEVTYAYLEDYAATVQSISKAEENGKNHYKEKYIKTLSSNSELPPLDEVSNFLKNNSWNSTEKSLFQPLRANVSNTTFLSKEFFDLKKPSNQNVSITAISGHNNSNKKWNQKISEILKKYDEALSQLDNQNTTARIEEPVINNSEKSTPISGKQSQSGDSQNQQPNVKWDPTVLYIILTFVVGLFLGMVAMLRNNSKKVRDIINLHDYGDYDGYVERSNGEYSIKFLNAVHFLNERKNKYKKDANKYSNDNETLNKKIRQLEEQEDKFKGLIQENRNEASTEPTTDPKASTEEVTKKWTFESKGPDTTPTAPTESLQRTSPATNKIVLFFSIPKSDGSFQKTNGGPSNDDTKYYKIEYEDSANTADIFFLSGKRDQRAIQNLETYLKPVCDIENIVDSQSCNRIEVLENGKVFLENDSWVVDPNNRLKIRLC